LNERAYFGLLAGFGKEAIRRMCGFGAVAEHAMSRMLFVALALISALPVKAEVLALSCDGTMNAEEQAKPHAITKMGLIVNFDAGVVNVSIVG
jgi:hypothetical protein